MTTASWTNCPMVFIPRVVCPRCNHDRWISIRSMPSEDASKTRRVVCRRCSSRFLIIEEGVADFIDALPEVGKGES